MQDPELAEIITAPDFVSEPDIIDSVVPEFWGDITTEKSWVEHLKRYQKRFGPGGELFETKKTP
jgi:hypothetical protein